MIPECMLQWLQCCVSGGLVLAKLRALGLIDGASIAVSSSYLGLFVFCFLVFDCLESIFFLCVTAQYHPCNWSSN